MPKSVLFQHLFSLIKRAKAEPSQVKSLLKEALRRALFDNIFDIYDEFDINTKVSGDSLFDMALKSGTFILHELIEFNPKFLLESDRTYSDLFDRNFEKIRKKNTKILESDFKNQIIGAFELKEITDKKIVNKLFISALEKKDEKLIIAFLKRLPKIRSFPIRINKVKGHLIHWATANDLCSLVKYLLSIDHELIDSRLDKTFETPLHIAAKHGKLQAYNLLLDQRVNPAALTRHKQSVLMLVLMYQPHKLASVMFQFWLDKSLPIAYEHKDRFEKTLFDYALGEHVRVLEKILPNYIESLRSDPKRLQKCFMYCAMNHQDKCIPLLLKNLPIDVNQAIGSLKRSALFFAIENGDYKNAQLYLRHGASVNLQDAIGLTPLMMAILKEDIAIVELLLSCGDVNLSICNKDGKHALAMAVDALNEDLACAILAKIKANSDSNGIMRGAGLSILHIAALYGDNKTILFMMRKTDYPVDVKSTKGETPLEIASRAGHHEAVALLMEFGRSSVASGQGQDRLSPTRLPMLNMT